MSKRAYIEQLFSTMGQLKKLLESHSHESHEERMATIMQFSGLKFLKNNGNCTVGDLGIHLNLSKSSATQLIERLAKAGLVKRFEDKNDRRIVRLVITEGGKQELINMKKIFMDRVGRLFVKIPDEDLQELIRIHTDLIEKLQKEGKN